MVKLSIDPEFRDKIPALTEEEFDQLRDNILADGEVYEPIITWNNVIVDGHNRWRVICENWEMLKDKFRVKPMEFADKWAAFEWMYKKQLGRRNLTDEQKAYMIGKMYEARKKSVGAQKGNANAEKQCAQNEHIEKTPNRTAESIAAEVGVGRETVKRSEKFSQGVDALRKVSTEAAEMVLAGTAGATKQDIAALAKCDEDDVKQMAEDIVTGDVKKRKVATWTKEDRKNREDTKATIAETRNVDSVPEYTIEFLIDDIKMNSATYIDLLRGLLKDHSTLLTDENRPTVVDAIEECVISEIVKIKELIK